MVTSSRSKFRNSALLSKLVTVEEIDEIEQILRADTQNPFAQAAGVDDAKLAERLIEKGLLTRYQADQLQSGRTKLDLGPYIVTDFIGQGGMGHVYKATHKVMGRECAVKVLPREKSTLEAIANFRREIRTQAKLSHPNLVTAFDAGEDGKVHYLVVEYVPGIDLRRLVRSQGKLTQQQSAQIIRQAAIGLQYAHESGLIHRDVKPGNILVTPEGIAKVSDLGLAGFLHEVDEDPRAGKIVGTADYLAPEQILSPGNITAVSDIYSLGCSLYYAVTGKVPYPGGTPRSKAQRHMSETPWHPRRFNEEISDEFVDIIADMMEKEPSARIQTMKEVAARLEPWASDSAPLLQQQMTRSPWMQAPLPTASMEEDSSVNLKDTGSATFAAVDFVPIDEDGSSQISQRTHSGSSAGQDTHTIGEEPPPPPILAPEEIQVIDGLSTSACVAIALAIAIPVSLLIGAIFGFVVRGIFW